MLVVPCYAKCQNVVGFKMKTDEKIDMSTTNSGAGIAQKLTLR
jgi:hypothetical protein